MVAKTGVTPHSAATDDEPRTAEWCSAPPALSTLIITHPLDRNHSDHWDEVGDIFIQVAFFKKGWFSDDGDDF